MDDIDAKKTRTVSWFSELRNRLCAAFEDIEDSLTGTEHAMLPAGRFERKIWQRDEGGGGEISLMRGRVFEKVGVNISTVHGTFSEDFRTQIPGAGDTGVFWAAGISLVAHMRSPLIPAVHMNARFIVTSKSWFGGGADLTPMFLDTEQTKSDTGLFHQALKNACDKHHADSYEKFSKWCDEYFYLKHRDERRGVGGIFYDYLEDDWQMNFDFTQHVGNAFLDVYPRIVRTHMQKPWTTAQREHQLLRRGRYVEFNLLYDRGTMFGLKTGGNTEAILMSLPPEVKWN